MKFYFILFYSIFSLNAFAERIDPDLDLHRFWDFSNSDQIESISLSINGIESLLRKNGISPSSKYKSTSSGEKISSMRECMNDYGAPYNSIGESYILCWKKLGWING